MTNKQSDLLKYLLISFLPVSIYAFILLNTSNNLSIIFHLSFMIVIGFIAQVAFRIYIEKTNV
ncbi:hypothetical protein ACO1PF_00200 [Alkalibacterium sp. f15]|uniref:hypothetical protein n=1 Tax=Alkalibacterium sp. f15 TaxID=3414029 RepID=UPI003BF8D30C